MAKRMLDGDKLWRSDKLRQVQPESFRAEYSNLYALALANGAFECAPDRVWCEVYAYNRPSISPETVREILREFERVKLLFRWQAGDGKTWGFWVGSEKMLPTPEQIRQSKYKIGEPVPKQQLAAFLMPATSNNVEQQGTRTWFGLDRNGLEWIGEDNVSIKNSLTDLSRAILGVRIGPQDSNWIEIKALVRVYGEEAVMVKFEDWAKSQTSPPNYPLSGFVRVADALLSGKFAASVSGEDLSALANGLVAVSDGRVIFNNNHRAALGALLVENSPADIKSAFQEFWGNISGDEFLIKQAAKTFTEAAEQLLYVRAKRRADARKQAEMIAICTENEQKQAAEELEARLKQVEETELLIEDTLGT
jgi:hypothetical protein